MFKFFTESTRISIGIALKLTSKHKGDSQNVSRLENIELKLSTLYQQKVHRARNHFSLRDKGMQYMEKLLLCITYKHILLKMAIGWIQKMIENISLI